MMKSEYCILVAEDDDNDFMLLRRAFDKSGSKQRLERVMDGLQAIDYLEGKGAFTDRLKFPSPDILIVDLKMPRMTGLELLSWIRDHPQYRVIPTLIMSSSDQQVDIAKAYDLGANTYFVKPSDFETLRTLVKSIGDYWLHGIRPAR